MAKHQRIMKRRKRQASAWQHISILRAQRGAHGAINNQHENGNLTGHQRKQRSSNNLIPSAGSIIKARRSVTRRSAPAKMKTHQQKTSSKAKARSAENNDWRNVAKYRRRQK